MKNKSGTTGGFKNRTVHNLIILDESGSMQAIKAATVQGLTKLSKPSKVLKASF